jgi:hypothetical protein
MSEVDRLSLVFIDFNIPYNIFTRVLPSGIEPQVPQNRRLKLNGLHDAGTLHNLEPYI